MYTCTWYRVLFSVMICFSIIFWIRYYKIKFICWLLFCIEIVKNHYNKKLLKLFHFFILKKMLIRKLYIHLYPYSNCQKFLIIFQLPIINKKSIFFFHISFTFCKFNSIHRIQVKCILLFSKMCVLYLYIWFVISVMH